eukprot:XP_011661831.1 PREDICTED: S-crystallin 1 [Strongylocentrotus purpuratus]
MPNYKLIYFNARGRAEPARMMFALRGGEYVDDRFTHEEWPERKTNKEMFPIGQAPVLLVDDKVIPQSAAISRYLARELNFYGANSLEAAQIDVVLETMADIEDKMMPLYADQDAAKKVHLYITSPDCGPHGSRFESSHSTIVLRQYINQHLALSISKYKIEGLLDSYPQLCAFCKSFRDEGPLKSYLESRPVTEA